MSYINKHLKQAASVILSVFLSAGMTGVSGIYAEEEPEEPEIIETSEETADPEEEGVQETGTSEEIIQETEEETEQPAEAEEEPVIPESDSETEEIIEEAAAVTEEALLADVSTWSALQDAFNAGGNVTLTTDIIASDSDTVLNIPNNTTVSLNLNGFMISRNLTSPRENGNVINVRGKLTINDTSSGQTGKITGGNNISDEQGGGITIYTSGELILNGGAVCGNHADGTEGVVGYGGGVFSYLGRFEMNGGTIRDNTAQSGGGICLWGNEAEAYIEDGAAITGNTAAGSNGAFALVMDAAMHIHGGTITGNHAGKYGGAVRNSSSFTQLYLSGNPVIENNTADEENADNIYFDGTYIYLDGNLDEEARIAVDFAHLPYDFRVPVEFGSSSSDYTCNPESFIIRNPDEFIVKFEQRNTGYTLSLYQKPVEIIYESDNGTGEIITDDAQRSGRYKLKDCYFTPPAGYVFAAWEIDGEEYLPGKSIPTGTEPITVKAVWSSIWTELQKKINLTSAGSVIKLETDYLDVENEGRLLVDSGKDVTIDLNGHTISRNRSEGETAGGVFLVEGKLTVNDSAGTGKITGGFSADGGGAFYIQNGTVVLNGGTITGNRAETPHDTSYTNGGGIYIKNGNLIINGGSITGNDTDGYGGGIYCDTDSSVTMNGGSITGNTSSYHGGGIYFAYFGGKFYVSGNPVVADNTASSTPQNVRLTYGQYIEIAGALSEDARIGVSTYYSPTEHSGTEFTKGLLNQGTADNFFADDPSYFIELNENDEAVLRQPQTLPEFKGHQLVLSGTLGLKFGVILPEGFNDPDSYVTFMLNDETQTVYTRDAEEKDGRKIYTCYMNTLQMAEKIRAVFHYGNNEKIYHDYSLTDYFGYFDKHESAYSPETLTLVHAVADYGYFAQPYLIKLHHLEGKYAEITKHYTDSFDYEEIKPAVAQYTFAKGISDSAVSNASYKLSLDADTALSVVMKVPAGTELTASSVFAGNTFTAEPDTEMTYIIKIPGIKASQLGDTITVSGEAEGNFTITVSALSYVRSVLNSQKYDETAKNAVSALYKYFEAVEAY